MGRDFINCPMSHLVVEKSADVHRDVDHCIEVGGDRAVLELKTRLEGFKESLEVTQNGSFTIVLTLVRLKVMSRLIVVKFRLKDLAKHL
jgi:hypothetical protein